MTELEIKPPAYAYTLEGYLLNLCRFGKPRLCSQANGKWYCAIDMFVEGKGVEFKIASEFGEPSMLEAVRVCYDRLIKALKDLGLEVVS